MATDWAKHVRKYAPDADDAVIAGIVRYCGIALRNRDSSLVSFSDPAELKRVRTNFLKKKLGLPHADDVLDAAIADVRTLMKSDRTRNRVTVYYLLAAAHDKLDVFVRTTVNKAAPAARTPAKSAKPATARKPAAKPAEAVAKTATTKAVAKPTAAASVVSDEVAVVTTSPAEPEVVAARNATPEAAVSTVSLAAIPAASDEDSGLGWLWWVLLALLAVFFVWWLFLRGSQ